MSDNETGAPFRECLSRFFAEAVLQQFGFVSFAPDEGERTAQSLSLHPPFIVHLKKVLFLSGVSCYNNIQTRLWGRCRLL